MLTKSEYTTLITEKALSLGLNDCGISKADYSENDASVLDNWLLQGHNAGMQWMENNADKRKDPQLLFPGARSVISVILNYYNPQMQSDPTAPVISRYAYGKDYHKVLKKKLKQLLVFIKEIIPEVNGRYFVDSAPILEHAFARNAGLGWIGKNSLLLTKKFGSYVFIGEIIIDKELEYNNPSVKDFCGNCSLCINECPTHAILPDRTVDANKCLSYLNIEHKGDLPSELKNAFYNRAYGCDICQDVCPWNRDLQKHNTPDFEPKDELLLKTRDEWRNLSEENFNELFSGSAVKRAKYSGLKRNINFLPES